MNTAQTTSENEVFVRNLPYSASQDTLRNFFKAAGQVENVSILKGKDGRPKGIAFVRFADESGVEKAVALSGKEIEGRAVFVEKKKPRVEGEEREERKSPQRREKVFSRNNNAGPRDNQGPTGNEIFVRNFPFTTDEDELRALFEKAGEVQSVNILRGFDGSSKGTAFVRFGDEDSVEKALDLDGTDVNGRQIQVQKRRPREEREDNERPRYGGNRGGYSGGYSGNNSGYSGNNGGNNGGNSSPTQRNSNSIFVGGLSYTTDEQGLRNFFKDCGNITAVRVAQDQDGRPKGFAHIDFENSDAVEKAIEKTDQELDGRTIRVDRSTDKRQGGSRGGFSRGGSRGGYNSGSRGGYNSGSRGSYRGGNSRGSRGGY